MRLVTYEVEHKGGLGVISRDGKWVYPLRSLDDFDAAFNG